MADIIIHEVGDMRIGEYAPGNGTQYTAVAVPWAFDGPMGTMGWVEDGWLVVAGNTTRAYLLQKRGHLVDHYIQGKFGLSEVDYPYFGDLIRKLVKRECSAQEAS